MSGRLGLLTVSLAFAVASACGAGIAVLGGAASCGIPTANPALPGQPALHTAHADWSATQVSNAATIIAVGADLEVPNRGWVIALATAMQESGLTNTPGGDRDSVGLFQQRPSQGWGTPQQLLDPVYSAGQFYHRLLAVPGWQKMPLSDAAQAVQHSAIPRAYAGSRLAAEGRCTDHPAQYGLPDTYTLPEATSPAVAIAVAWALDQLGTPYHFGGDCSDPHSGNPARQCDCSSLVQQAYRTAGITLPRTAADQSRTGTPIPDPARLQPGDLLFVPGADGTATRPGHVGLFIGDQLVLDAPHDGAVVQVSRISRYWLTDLTIRRIIRTPPPPPR